MMPPLEAFHEVVFLFETQQVRPTVDLNPSDIIKFPSLELHLEIWEKEKFTQC
jgi:hypothetical protein